MSSWFQRHPEESALLRYLDGELSARRAKHVARHLENCGPCRASLEGLRNSWTEYAAYQSVLRAELSAPPMEWRDLYGEFSRIDESLANEPLLVRLVRPMAHAGAPRWAIAAVSAMLVVTGVYYQLRQAPAVQAATLLKKAVAAAEAKPRKVRRVHFRTAQREFTRIVGPQAPILPAAAAPIEAMFQAAHFDFDDPLSARSFAQWRDAQPHKTDEVSKVAGPLADDPKRSATDLPSSAPVAGECYRITTTAAEGEIAEATLTLRSDDLAPVEERLEFRDREWVEMTEIADPSIGSGATSVAANNEVPVRAAEPPSRPAAFTPGPSASISDELQVLYALHQIGADLGDPVDASLSNGKVVVSVGDGTPASHRQKIQELQGAMVEVVLEAPQPAPEPAPAAVSGGGGSAPVPAIQSRVEKQLGGRIQFERFSSRILQAEDEAMAHVYALHRLAQKIPVESESQLSGADRELLLKLSREHADVLSQKMSELKTLLLPTLASLGGTSALERAGAPHAAWQPATEDLLRAGSRVDKLVSVLLGATPSPGSTAGLPSELMTALRELDANLADCQRLVVAQ